MFCPVHISFFQVFPLEYTLKVLVAQSCQTLWDCTVHGILQARILEQVAISFSRGSSLPRDQTRVSHVVGRCFYRLSQGSLSKFSKPGFKQYVNRELPDVQAGFRKGRGTRDQIASICWIIEKAREFQKNIYFCFINLAKSFDCVDQTYCGKF